MLTSPLAGEDYTQASLARDLHADTVAQGAAIAAALLGASVGGGEAAPNCWPLAALAARQAALDDELLALGVNSSGQGFGAEAGRDARDYLHAAAAGSVWGSPLGAADGVARAAEAPAGGLSLTLDNSSYCSLVLALGGSGVEWIGTIDGLPTTLVYAFNGRHAYEIAPSVVGEGAAGDAQCSDMLQLFLSTLKI